MVLEQSSYGRNRSVLDLLKGFAVSVRHVCRIEFEGFAVCSIMLANRFPAHSLPASYIALDQVRHGMNGRFVRCDQDRRSFQGTPQWAGEKQLDRTPRQNST